MFLTLFIRLTYLNVLHYIFGVYYYGFLVNEGIGLFLLIQQFYPSSLSILYKYYISKDVIYFNCLKMYYDVCVYYV